jgi:hypothetical protein
MFNYNVISHMYSSTRLPSLMLSGSWSSSLTAYYAHVRCSCGMPIITLQITERILVAVRRSLLYFRVFVHSNMTFSPCSTWIYLAVACEVLARRIVHIMDPDRLNVIMSTRFRHIDWDGDDSAPASALEIACDQHWQVP